MKLTLSKAAAKQTLPSTTQATGKRRKATIGEERTWGGKVYVLTAKGWRPKAKGRRKGQEVDASGMARNQKIIQAAKMGANLDELSKVSGVSKARITQILSQAKKQGEDVGARKKHRETVHETFAKIKGGERGANVARRGSLRAASEAVPNGQPYEESGIYLARAADSQMPTVDYISSNIGGSLREHQRDYVNLAMQQFEKGYAAMSNFDGTGAGKTRSEIGLAATYLDHNPNARIVIVTESDRIMQTAFGKDADAMNVAIQPIKKQEDFAGKAGIYITTYNDLRRLDLKDVNLVVADECHNLKNGAASKKAQVGIKLLTDADHAALFSATPLDKAQHIEYLCAAYRLNFRDVMKYLGYKKIGFAWQTNQPAMVTAQKLDAIFSDLTKRGLAIKREVPLRGLDTNIKTINLSPDYKSRYDAAVEKMVEQVQQAEPKEKGLLKAQWLMKIRAILEESKIEHSMSEIKDALSKGRQVVLFATQVNDRMLREAHSDHLIKYSAGTLKTMAKMLQEEGIPFVNIYGSNKAAAEGVKKFQAGEIPVVIGTFQSAGTGISLDDVHGNKPRTAVLMTSPFSATDMIQSMGRVHRLTTKSKSEVRLLSTDTEVDTWNRGIIANKLTALGGTVKGDYEKLNIHDLEKLEMMTPDEAKKFREKKNLQNTSIPVASPFTFDPSHYGTGTSGVALRKARHYSHFVLLPSEVLEYSKERWR